MRDAAIYDRTAYAEAKAVGRVPDGDAPPRRARRAWPNSPALPEADVVLVAVVGTAGLEPALAAIAAGKDLALASKEILVLAGKFVMEAVRRHGTRILPVDSEHNAVFQCVEGHPSAGVQADRPDGERRRVPRLARGEAGARDARRRPQASQLGRWARRSPWTRATLANKGLELMEAQWLFGLRPEQCTAVMHPQSIVHCLVEFNDGAMLAQLSPSSMTFPIQHALLYPERVEGVEPPIDFTRLVALDFSPVDEAAIPMMRLAGGHGGRRRGPGRLQRGERGGRGGVPERAGFHFLRFRGSSAKLSTAQPILNPPTSPVSSVRTGGPPGRGAGHLQASSNFPVNTITTQCRRPVPFILVQRLVDLPDRPVLRRLDLRPRARPLPGRPARGASTSRCSRSAWGRRSSPGRATMAPGTRSRGSRSAATSSCRRSRTWGPSRARARSTRPTLPPVTYGDQDARLRGGRGVQRPVRLPPRLRRLGGGPARERRRRQHADRLRRADDRPARRHEGREPRHRGRPAGRRRREGDRRPARSRTGTS